MPITNHNQLNQEVALVPPNGLRFTACVRFRYCLRQSVFGPAGAVVQHQSKHFLIDAFLVTSFDDLNKHDHSEQQNLNVSYVSYVRPQSDRTILSAFVTALDWNNPDLTDRAVTKFQNARD